MEVAVWLSPIVAALIGVWLGGLLSIRSQDRGWHRQESQHWRDARRSACSELVTAVRQYRAYLIRSDAKISIESNPDGFRLVPLFDEDGSAHHQSIEAAFANVQLVAAEDQTVMAAATLFRTARRVAVARVLYGSAIPARLTRPLWQAERDFINAARRELGLHDVVAETFGPNSALSEIDRELRETFDLISDQPRVNAHPGHTTGSSALESG